VIIADTGALLALFDRDERHHDVLREQFEGDPGAWRVPWAVLPELDYLLASRLGDHVERAFLADLADGTFAIEWGDPVDLVRAEELARKHKSLKLGLVDCVVMAVAERLGAEAIATLDVRHFAAVKIRGGPKLLPRDL